MNWTNIKTDELYVSYNSNYKPILYSCNWCGNGAYRSITRTSTFSGNTYTDYICDRCLEDKWKINIG